MNRFIRLDLLEDNSKAAVASSAALATSSTLLLVVAVRVRRTRTTSTRVSLSVCVFQLAEYSHVTGVDFVQEKFLGQGPQDNEVGRHLYQ